jgi:translation initiation factor IF-2
LKQELTAFPSDQVKLAVVHAGVGVVTESDVLLAQASRAIIIAFHVVPDPVVRRMAEDEGVDVRSYRVIYNVIDDVRKALEGLLTPEEKAEFRGRVEVREIFNISRVGRIAGCFVRDGLVNRDHRVRIVRDGVVVRDECAIASLKRFKDDVKEVKGGFECGIRIESFNDVKPGDIIESFEIIKVAKTLSV